MRAALIALLLLVSGGAAFADSLWTGNAQSLFVDRRAHRVGDILSVLIVEAVSASHSATHQTTKEVSAEAQGGLGLLSFFPRLGLSASRGAAGSGSNITSTRITDRISVTVVAVDLLGNMSIAGQRTMELGPDKLELQFAGKVRPEDVGADNSVLSSDVADLVVTWAGKGPIAEKQKSGLLYRLLHFLW